MKDRVFIDTNILIYLYSTDQEQKQMSAQKLIEKNNCFISTQVLQEFSNTLRNKYKAEWRNIKAAIDEVATSASVFTNHEETIKRAIEVAEKYKYSFYDSLIIAAALETACTILYSEDMQHKQMIYGKLQIINPFAK
jgi:predicted nucleic acid-binding protein